MYLLFQSANDCNIRSVTVAARISAKRARLTPAERRVAEVVSADPQAVAFGTVAELARRSRTSGPTVVRLAAKLGFEGFVDLQSTVRDELADALRPAAERIRQRPAADPLSQTLNLELENVHATLEAVDPAAFREAVALLSGRNRRLFVVSGDASRGVAGVAADQLDLLRPGVVNVAGAHTAVTRQLAPLKAGDVVLVVDLRRYERWVLDTARAVAARDARVVALTDSPVSPLAELASPTFVVAARGAGPFDSHVGTLALLNALVTGVANRLRASATQRLDAVEQAWRQAGALVER